MYAFIAEQENSKQQKLCIWTLFKDCLQLKKNSKSEENPHGCRTKIECPGGPLNVLHTFNLCPGFSVFNGITIVNHSYLFRAGPLVGLFVIAVATGGIKPCVSVLGGNQFEAGQVSSQNPQHKKRWFLLVILFQYAD